MVEATNQLQFVYVVFPYVLLVQLVLGILTGMGITIWGGGVYFGIKL